MYSVFGTCVDPRKMLGRSRTRPDWVPSQQKTFHLVPSKAWYINRGILLIILYNTLYHEVERLSTFCQIEKKEELQHHMFRFHDFLVKSFSMRLRDL